VNGVALDHQSLIFLSGNAPARSVEPRGNLHAIVNFSLPIQGRGWPLSENRLHLLKAGSTALGNLSQTVLDLFRFASEHHTYIAIPGIAQAMQESLLTAIDEVLAGNDAASVTNRRALDRYIRLVRKLDQILAVNPAVSHYSEELAHECDTSVRTLQTAIATIRGTSLHHYLRLRRFWSVRQRLMRGGAGLTVRACALANGFWHMGEFALAYRETFGESPTETLAKARY